MLNDDFETYNPCLLGFIINVPRLILDAVKKEVVSSIRTMESDEKSYTYHPDNQEIPRWPGQAVGKVGNYQAPMDFDLPSALKQTILLFSMEDFDFDKNVFIILNKDDDAGHRLTKSIAWAEKEDCECNFHFICINECKNIKQYCEENEECHYVGVREVEDIKQAVCAIYHKNEMPLFVKNYQRLDIHELKKENNEIQSDDQDETDECW